MPTELLDAPAAPPPPAGTIPIQRAAPPPPAGTVPITPTSSAQTTPTRISAPITAISAPNNSSAQPPPPPPGTIPIAQHESPQAPSLPGTFAATGAQTSPVNLEPFAQQQAGAEHVAAAVHEAGSRLGGQDPYPVTNLAGEVQASPLPAGPKTIDPALADALRVGSHFIRPTPAPPQPEFFRVRKEEYEGALHNEDTFSYPDLRRATHVGRDGPDYIVSKQVHDAIKAYHADHPAPEPAQSVATDLMHLPANVGAGITRGVGGMVGTVGGMIESAGEPLNADAYARENIDSQGNLKQPTALMQAGRVVQRQGDYLAEGAAKTERDLPVQGGFAKSMVGVGELGVDAAMSTLVGPSGFVASFAGRSAGTMYVQAKAQGDDETTATGKGITAGFASAIIPQITHILPPKVGQEIAVQVARAYMGTGGMVAAQAVADELTLKAGTTQKIDLSHVFPEAATQGLIGVAMHGGGHLMGKARGKTEVVAPQTADNGSISPQNDPLLNTHQQAVATERPQEVPPPPEGTVPIETQATPTDLLSPAEPLPTPPTAAEVPPPPPNTVPIEAAKPDLLTPQAEVTKEAPHAPTVDTAEKTAETLPEKTPEKLAETVAAPAEGKQGDTLKEPAAKPVEQPPQPDQQSENRPTDQLREDVAVGSHEPEITPKEPVSVGSAEADNAPAVAPIQSSEERFAAPEPRSTDTIAVQKQKLGDQVRHLVATSAEHHDDLLHQRARTNPGETQRQRGFQKSATVGQRVAQGNLEPKALVDLPAAKEMARALPEDHPAHLALKKLEALENSPQKRGVPEVPPTSIKNEVTAQERAKRDMPEAVKAAKRGFGEVWDNAGRDLQENPDLANDLVKKLKDAPRAMTDHEDALLLHHQIELQNLHRKLTDKIIENHDTGGEDAASLRTRLAAVSDQLLDVYNVGKSSGTETARGLNARKMMATEDYSLAAMETAKRANVGGRELTAAEHAQIADLHEKVAKTQKAFDDYVKQAEATQAELQSKMAHARLRVKAQTGTEPKATGQRAGVLDKLIKSGDAAGERLRKKFFGSSTTFSAEAVIAALPDATLWTAAQLAKLTKATGKAAGELFGTIKERLKNLMGEAIEPHFQTVFDDAVKMHAEAAGDRKKAILDSIKEKVSEKNATGISRYIQLLAKDFVTEGVTDREKLIDKVHAAIKDVAPEMTRRQTMDAISGYGEFKQLSKDEVAVKLRDLKGQMQQVGKLADMTEKGQAPLKTGVERREPSQEERRLIQEVNATKKKLGIQTTDAATQLKSTLDGVKTRLKNQIADLQFQVDSGQKIERAKTPGPRDAETNTLTARRDELKKQYDAIFGKEGLTDQQRLKLATAAVERGIKDYEQRLADAKAGKFDSSKPDAAPRSAELEALRTRRDAMREELKLLRDSDPTIQEDKRQQGLRDSIDELNRKIAENDIAPKGKAATVDTREVAALKARKELLAKSIQKMRDARNAPTPDEATARAEEVKQTAIQKSIDALEKKIAAGDLSAKPKTATVDTQVVGEMKRRRDELNKQLEDMRKAAGPPPKTADQIALQAFKTRTLNRIADLADKMAREDYAPPGPRRELALDSEGTRLKAENERIKLEWQRSLLRDRMKNRTATEKVLDAWSGWRRASVLSSPVVVGKLSAAALEGNIASMGEEAIGGAISKAFPKLAARAPVEGGYSVKAEGRAWSQGILQTIKQFGTVLKTGKTDIDLLFGKDNGVPPSVLDYVGHLHKAMKLPRFFNAYARTLEKLGTAGIRDGLDVHDPIVQTRLMQQAYVEAERAIFQNDNRVVTAYKRWVAGLEQPDKATGKTPLSGKLGATAARTLLPIVKVPTNLVHQTLQYAFGSVTGGYKLARAYAGGIQNLSPAEADSIMRLLKKGSLGAAGLAIGFMNPNSIGGFYEPGKERDKKDVEVGGARVFGVDIPRWLLHNPLLETLQIGATVRRIADSRMKKSSPETKGLAMGILDAGEGLAEEVPFVKGTVEAAKLLDPEKRAGAAGRLAESLVVPSGVSWAAQKFDEKDAEGEPVKRKPEGIKEHIEMGIPGLRQKVPKATEVERRPASPGKTAWKGDLTKLHVEEATQVFERMSDEDRKKHAPAMRDTIARSKITAESKEKLRKRLGL